MIAGIRIGILVVGLVFLQVGCSVAMRHQNHPSGKTDTRKGIIPYDRTEWSWTEFRDDQHGFTAMYPAEFFYPSGPPKLLITHGTCATVSFPEQCPDISDVVDTAWNHPLGSTRSELTKAEKSGRQEFEYWSPDGDKLDVNGLIYCLSVHSEGATGTRYDEYYFTTVRNGACYSVYFVVRTGNCDVFVPDSDIPEERESYKKCRRYKDVTVPQMIDRIARSFEFAE